MSVCESGPAVPPDFPRTARLVPVPCRAMPVHVASVWKPHKGCVAATQGLLLLYNSAIVAAHRPGNKKIWHERYRAAFIRAETLCGKSCAPQDTFCMPRLPKKQTSIKKHICWSWGWGSSFCLPPLCDFDTCCFTVLAAYRQKSALRDCAKRILHLSMSLASLSSGFVPPAEDVSVRFGASKLAKKLNGRDWRMQA